MILFDTHAWVWWLASPERLSAPAREAIDEAMEQREIFISSISSWEIALLLREGRLELTMPVEDWVARTEALPFLQFVAVDNPIALRSNRLPGTLHEDPAAHHHRHSPQPGGFAGLQGSENSRLSSREDGLVRSQGATQGRHRADACHTSPALRFAPWNEDLVLSIIADLSNAESPRQSRFTC